MVIKVKYFKNHEGLTVEPLKKIDKGDWIDLRANETISLRKGDFRLIPLGIGMKLPEGYEAHIVPRSSTFKNWGILQTNSMAIIDNSYSGNNDQWWMPVFATKNTIIQRNDRICQFRIVKRQPIIEFDTVEFLDDVDRGSFGSTGKQ
jgi:dUTP pyrophosphatase